MKSSKQRYPNNLWVTRKQLGYSQKRVAHLLRYGDTTMLSKYEHGERPPPLLKAIRFAQIYKATVEELFPELVRQEKTNIAKLQSK